MKVKNKIIEICELGQPQSIIHRENEPITELIKTDSLIEELKEQLTLTDVSQQREPLLAYHKHLDSFNDPTIYNASESMIDDYLANNCG
mgnify:CR=1 FL=1